MITTAMRVLTISPTNSRPRIGCGIRLHLEHGTKPLCIKGIVDESYNDPETQRAIPARILAVNINRGKEPTETERVSLLKEIA
jgi:hypothetical protein